MEDFICRVRSSRARSGVPSGTVRAPASQFGFLRRCNGHVRVAEPAVDVVPLLSVVDATAVVHGEVLLHSASPLLALLSQLLKQVAAVVV